MDPTKPIIVGDKIFRPFVDKNLTESDLEKARIQLKETPLNTPAALQKLKNLLAKEKGLTPRLDDSYLLRFLRARKFDCDRARKLIKACYKHRANYPKVFRTPCQVEDAIRSGFSGLATHRDQDGSLIFIFKAGKWNPEKVSFEDFSAAVNLMSEFSLHDPLSQIHGIIGIWDAEGFSFKHFFEVCSLWRLSFLKANVQECYPGRLKMICAINCGSAAVTLWNILRPVLKKKLRNRVHVLGSDMSELHKLLDPAILPEEYGGKLPPSNFEKSAQDLLDREDYFKNDLKFGYDKIDL